MNESVRWMLCLGCLLLVALEAPQAALLVLEDLAGPYSARTPASVQAPLTSAALVAAMQRPVVDASLSVLGLRDLTAQSAPSSNRAPHLSEDGNDLDSNSERAGWNFLAAPER